MTLAALALLTGCATPLADQRVDPRVVGHWQMIGNRFQSRVTLDITASAISGEIGCTHWRGNLVARVGHYQYATPREVLTMGSPCSESETHSVTAEINWTRIISTLTRVTTYSIRRGVLTLRTDAGDQLRFERQAN